MARKVLSEDKIHPAAREKIASNHADIVAEVEAAIAKHDVVVVGMAQNPHPKRVRKALKAKGVAHEYLEYGSYTSRSGLVTNRSSPTSWHLSPTRSVSAFQPTKSSSLMPSSIDLIG